MVTRMSSTNVSSTFASTACGLAIDRRVLKNALTAPSARYLLQRAARMRAGVALVWFDTAVAVRIARGAVGPGRIVGVEAELRLVGVGHAVAVGVVVGAVGVGEAVGELSPTDRPRSPPARSRAPAVPAGVVA